jgi:hypothetical protein
MLGLVKTSLWGEGSACTRSACTRARAVCRWLPVWAIALAGCGTGASSKPLPHELQNRVAAVSQAPQLVSMRRINGATYQTVVIRTDGSGEVGEFIGEWTGVVHQQFRVGPRELDQLRRFIEIAADSQRTPAFGPDPSTEYIIFAHGHVLETAKGHVPRRLAPLTGILSGLIDRYS